MAVASNAVSMLSFGTTLNATKKAATSRTTVRKYQPKKAAITFSCVRIAVSQAPSVRRPCSQRPRGPCWREGVGKGPCRPSLSKHLSSLSTSAPARNLRVRR
jgi:hypothetical protein